MASPLKEHIHQLIRSEKLSQERKQLETERAHVEAELELNPSSETWQRKLLEIDHRLDNFEGLSELPPKKLRVMIARELSLIHPNDPINVDEYLQSLEKREKLETLEKHLKLISDHLQVILDARVRIKKRSIFGYILSVSPNTYIEQTLIALEKLLPKVAYRDALSGLEECLDRLLSFAKQHWSFKTVDQNVDGFQKEIEKHLEGLLIEKSANQAMICAEEAHLDRTIEEKGLDEKGYLN